ncbi:nitrogen metabolic regulation protein [Pyricularia oryzae 70-15]|uniref:Nitrogen metabolic regulation protein n=3 Tax=Pyricularia oryzae TaxID=318829 RepID=G4MWW5_PYRO7|nr:nitrogen metabolic regulation protein [Pyricularia oryzae 70-15]EHA55969.1 nitrogen metabolic regulation protein [Pyricularia oryzae 70-15]ELQ34442.1 nitrogen metabolic regulation protein [Pyricularia oryzae Y34]KAI7918801.1 nitrogen metabolic regulation protein [Pyricularia oryzae]KAI7922373.1 nitrogen metabolic regulation protein [Pyricularia oryzae]
MVGEIQVDLAIRPAVPIPTSTKPRSIGVSAPTTASPNSKGGVAIAINNKNHHNHNHHNHNHNHFNVHQHQYYPHHHHHDQEVEQQLRRHKHKLSSYSSEGSPLSQSRNNSLTFNRPAKRQMATPDQTIAVINASGRQTASLIRYCTAVGFKVRAQLRNTEGVIATEVCSNPNVTVLVGELYTRQPSASRADVSAEGPLSGIGVNEELIRELFSGCQLAFINTTFYGDEVAIGKALADEALAAGISHFIYSSMPDYAAYNPNWPSLPLYRSKHQVEAYVRSLQGLESTFVYAGIYNNNFTSLPYPLFCMELQEDGSFMWQAPFHPDAKLPWVDCEHDFGTAILSIFKEGPKRWGGGRRVPIAFEMLTPLEACRKFSSGVGRPVRYVRGPIEIKVKIPEGYRTQLDMVQRLYSVGGDDASRQPPYFGDWELEAQCPDVALELWGGPRTLEEYAREEFIIEEQANGLRWMMVGDKNGHHNNHHHHRYDEGAGREVTQPPDEEEDGASENDDDEYDDDDDGLVMRGPKRLEEKWLA